METDDHVPTSLCATLASSLSHLTPAVAATHCSVTPLLDHTSASDIVAVLRDLDSLEKLYSDTVSEMCSVKSTLRVEVKKVREAAETYCADLEKEKQHLLENRLASYKQIVQQLDYASKYAKSMQSLEDMKNRLASLEKVQEMEIETLNASHAITEEDLRRQIMYEDDASQYFTQDLSLYSRNFLLQQGLPALGNDLSLVELRKDAAAKEHATACLEKQLSQTITPDFFELKLKETEKKLHEKYLTEQAELRKTFASEEMKTQKLQTDLTEAQQSLISWKVKYDDQLREISANRHADVFKQKVMKLRKDNEMLKRQLQDLQKHK